MPNQHRLHGQPLRRGVGLRRGLAEPDRADDVLVVGQPGCRGEARVEVDRAARPPGRRG